MIIARREQVDFGNTLKRYQAFGADAANSFDGSHFTKIINEGRETFAIRLSTVEEGICLTHSSTAKGTDTLAAARRAAQKLLGLDFDLDAFYDFSKGDPVLRKVVKKYPGLRPTLTISPFEMIVTSITAQQINLKFAFSTRSAFVRAYGDPFIFEGDSFFSFPTPERVAMLEIAELRQLKFSTRKAKYIIGLAQAITSGKLNLAKLATMDDARIHDELLKLKGIGQWTVDWFMARYLGRGDAIAVGDLGVRKAIGHYYFNGEKKSVEETQDFARRWGQFSNLAIHYLLFDLYMGTEPTAQ